MIKRKYTKKKKNQKMNKVISGSIIGFVVITMLIFGDMGLIKYFQLKKQSEQLRFEIKSLINESKYLTDQIGKLENDMDYIESLAREEFQMAKKGEKVFRIINLKNNNNTDK